jgi:hypothetical protein
MTTTTNARRRSTLRRWAAASAFLLLAVLGRPVHATVVTPARVVVADLRGVTTITWSGQAAVRLRVPKDVLLPAESAYRITRHDGSFVSVRAFPNPQPIGCERDFQQKWCVGTWLDWLRGLAVTSGHGTNTGDPSRDFLAGVTDPPVVQRGGWDLYLFSDGPATLEITARGLSGRAYYQPMGRFTGRAVHNPGPCRLAACLTGPVYADQRTGGYGFDAGQHSFVQALAYGGIKPHDVVVPGMGNGQAFSLRTCMYPSRLAPDASPDPAAHPGGCDTVPPSSAEDSALGTVDEIGSVGGGVGGAYYTAGSYDARGRVYLGFKAGSTGPDEPRLGGLLVFLRYGIR